MFRMVSISERLDSDFKTRAVIIHGFATKCRENFALQGSRGRQSAEVAGDLRGSAGRRETHAQFYGGRRARLFDSVRIGPLKCAPL